ncbi:MAG: hypothetical protein M1829_002448 [Trizodia sp. TS-e1964]|nr:MAG: hypothetical protein M1829_002448 [Trizodia sp. TS-e1964]
MTPTLHHFSQAGDLTPAPLVWINGLPGSGKLTVARLLIQLLGKEKAKLIDNHQMIDPVEIKFPRDHPEYQNERQLLRKSAFSTYVADASMRSRTIIFTDFQSDNELGRSVSMEYKAAAIENGRVFLPIHFVCDLDENLRRLKSIDRTKFGTNKLTSCELLKDFHSRCKLFSFGASELKIDVTHLLAIEVAAKVHSHIITELQNNEPQKPATDRSLAKPGWRFVLHGGCANTYPHIDRKRDIESSLGRIADEAAKSLEKGMTARQVVVQIVLALEDCELFNAGKGSAFTLDGCHELEAGIVDGHSTSYGAVCCVATTKNPILTANALLFHGPHCMLVGQAADDLSKKLGLETVDNKHFSTTFRRTHWEQQDRLRQKKPLWDMGTVGAVVLDSYGHIAAGGSTGGLTGKLRGRIGDTAVLGAGLFGDTKVGVVCSGEGDQILRELVATKVANYHRSGLSLKTATRRAVSDMSLSGKPCAIAAIDSKGVISVQSTAQVFYTALGSSNSPFYPYFCPMTMTINPEHIFYNNSRLITGLSRYPTSPGHTLVILTQSDFDIFSLNLDVFTGIMLCISKVAAILSRFYNIGRCALVTEGSDTLSILPLHGLDKRVASYGPQMDVGRLDDICSRIQKVSGLSSPFQHNFKGDQSNQNIFARIVRGELLHWRIWEDDQHVAFLTPFPNTPGFTVLVPRTHLASDIFSLDKEAYISLMVAAHTVAGILKEAFGACRCGMIFEGFEIDYAHVKLIPIHDQVGATRTSSVGSSASDPTYANKYPGFVTSLNGPLVENIESLTNDALSIRKYFQGKSVSPPHSWQSPSDHLFTVLKEPWYSNLLHIQDFLFHTSVDFFKQDLGYKYALVPATIDAISSPMGLGSDSEPVQITLFGQNTHLADSMQFALEYFLRIKDELPGVYYINTSFRGENPDAMHLNQFYHVECELLGNFSEGISVAEKYIINLVLLLLQDHEEHILVSAGNTNHLKTLLDQYRSNNGKFPQITQNDALKLPIIDSGCWKYVVPSDPRKGRSITREGELKLIKYFGGAVWLTEMDHLSVPFYQAFTDETCAQGRCADLLLGNGELLGLGERHMSSKEVLTALYKHEVPIEPYKWYMQIRDTNPVLTTGWGMGVERFLAWVLQHNDIRNLAIIPRMKGHSFAL